MISARHPVAPLARGWRRSRGRSLRAANSTRNSSISIGKARSASASATAQSSTGSRSSRSGLPSLATAGATSATLVVHDTSAAEPEQHDRQHGDLQELEQPAEPEVHRADGRGAGCRRRTTRSAPPRNSRIHNQRGTDGSTPRGMRAIRAVTSDQHADQRDRHPARIERQQHADRGDDEQLRARPQFVDDGAAGHRPQQHDGPCAGAAAAVLTTRLRPSWAPGRSRRRRAGAACAGTAPRGRRSRAR